MSNAVLVCGWSAGGAALSEEFQEVLTLGRGLAEKLGGQLGAVVVGDLPADAAALVGSYGATTLDHLADAKLAWGMLRRGKLKLLPRSIDGKRELRAIFDRPKKG